MQLTDTLALWHSGTLTTPAKVIPSPRYWVLIKDPVSSQNSTLCILFLTKLRDGMENFQQIQYSIIIQQGLKLKLDSTWVECMEPLLWWIDIDSKYLPSHLFAVDIYIQFIYLTITFPYNPHTIASCFVTDLSREYTSIQRSHITFSTLSTISSGISFVTFCIWRFRFFVNNLFTIPNEGSNGYTFVTRRAVL